MPSRKISKEELGTIVNELEDDTEVKEIEEKLKAIQERLVLHPAPNVYDRLYKMAEFRGLSVEDYALNVLEESLQQLIGVPHITGPSKFGNSPSVAKKIQAPSSSLSVTRG
jgi:predicted mannosyl-3-phosphoglycerate phosphatase (HAD superfamily)